VSVAVPGGAEAPAVYDRLAAVYDRWLSGDETAAACLEFYRGVLPAEDRDVLELGCGTGRIAAALAEDGRRRVVGLDGSMAMLELARSRLAAADLAGEARLVAGQLDLLPFEAETFDAVLLPMRTIGHVLEVDERLACFREVARVLRPGGRFVLDHYQLDRGWAERHDGVPRLMYAGPGDAPASALNIWDRYDYDFPCRRLRCTVRLQVASPVSAVVSVDVVTFDFAWFEVQDVVALGAAAGLTLESCWGSFDREPFDAGADEMVFVFRKPRDVA